MTWLWVLIGVLGGLYLLYRLFVGFFGNWRMTLNSVITQFVAITMNHPNEDFEYWSSYLFEARYPPVASGPRRHLYENRLTFENILDESLFRYPPNDLVYSYLTESTLPSIILACLMIEGHSKVRSNKEIEALYPEIVLEVKRQGFSKYC